MPPLKSVPTLLDLTIESVSVLVELEAFRLAEYVVTHFKYEELEEAVRGLAQNQVNYFNFCSKTRAGSERQIESAEWHYTKALNRGGLRLMLGW